MSIQVEIGKEIVSVRRQNGITQEDLAYGTGISVSHLRRIEHGNGNPTVSTLSRLAVTLNRSLIIIMGKQDEKD